MQNLPIPETIQNLKPLYSSLWFELPPVITRKKLCELIPILRPGTLANLDSLGKGPAGRITMGGKVCYPRIEVILWLASRETRKGV